MAEAAWTYSPGTLEPTLDGVQYPAGRRCDAPSLEHVILQKKYGALSPPHGGKKAHLLAVRNHVSVSRAWASAQPVTTDSM
eukprot:21147-Eustigmatos_ZCMA.PRE.1